jgi:hypothetical protein
MFLGGTISWTRLRAEKRVVANDPLIDVLKQVADRQTDARVLVLVTNGLIELMINTLVAHFCRHSKTITGDNRAYPYSTRLLILNEKGVLPDPLFETLDRLRRLRNDAAHQPFFSVDQSRIRQIAEPLERGLFAFPKKEGLSYPSENLGDFCLFLVHSLFNNYQGIFLPIFAPSLHEASRGDQASVI